MGLRRLFLYPEEDLGIRTFLRAAYMFFGLAVSLVFWAALFSLFSGFQFMVYAAFCAVFTPVLTFYWSPLFQEKLWFRNNRRRWLSFLLLTSLFFSLIVQAVMGWNQNQITLLGGLISASESLALIKRYSSGKEKSGLEILLSFCGSHGRRVLKLLLAALGVMALLLLALSMLGWGASYYVNSMAAPLNSDASIDPSVKKTFYRHSGEEGIEKDRLETVYEKEWSQDRVSRRSKIGGIALWDVAKTGGEIYDSFNQSPNRSYRGPRGFATSTCRSGTCRHSSRFQGRFTQMTAGWLRTAAATGDLHSVYTDEDGRKNLTNYTVRAEYYDSLLNPDGFRLKPVEHAAYSDSGLHVIGVFRGNLTVNNLTVPTERKSNWLYANTSLSPGHHLIRAGNYSLEIKVHPPMPAYGLVNESFQITVENSSGFEKARLEGEGWSRQVRLGDNSTVQVDLPEEAYRLEKSDLTGEYRKEMKAYSITFIAEEVNVTRTQHSRSFEPIHAEIFGMEKREYRKMRQLMDKLPFSRERSEDALMGGTSFSF